MKIFSERYQRQTILPQLGEAGQHKLLTAKVLVIGAGGLGCPALQYLTAAGIGTIGITDNDVVSLSNLHRQVLFGNNDIGLSKALIATKKLSQLNNEINIHSYELRLTNHNALALIEQYDIILDCSDNFATRYMINDACRLLRKPLIFGAIAQFEGQLAVFNVPQKDGGLSTDYRAIFATPPAEGEVQNCAEAGVIGVLPGIIGCMMANETIKLITGIGKPLINQLMVIDILTYQQRIFNVSIPANSGTIPATVESFLATDYIQSCSPLEKNIISVTEFIKLLQQDHMLVDVREVGELPLVNGISCTQIPLSVIEEKTDGFNNDLIILFCQSGKRSFKAAGLLSARFGTTKKIVSLQNGIADVLAAIKMIEKNF